jgi:hypothetical protein
VHSENMIYYNLSVSDPLPPKRGINFGAIVKYNCHRTEVPFRACPVTTVGGREDLGVRKTYRNGLKFFSEIQIKKVDHSE